MKNLLNKALGIILMSIGLTNFYFLMWFYNTVNEIFSSDFFISIIFITGYIFGALLWILAGFVAFTDKGEKTK
mgnify:CR=1 FL=1